MLPTNRSLRSIISPLNTLPHSLYDYPITPLFYNRAIAFGKNANNGIRSAFQTPWTNDNLSNFSETIESSQNRSVNDAIDEVKDQLQTFADSPTFAEDMAIAFGENANDDTISAFQTDWANGEFPDFPEIEIVDGNEINDVNGAFSQDTGKIYLNQDFVNENVGNIDVIAGVLLDQYGHFIDSMINETDAPGDEGYIFARLVQRER